MHQMHYPEIAAEKSAPGIIPPFVGRRTLSPGLLKTLRSIMLEDFWRVSGDLHRVSSVSYLRLFFFC